MKDHLLDDAITRLLQSEIKEAGCLVGIEEMKSVYLPHRNMAEDGKDDIRRL